MRINESVREEIRKSINECENFHDVEGSHDFYQRLIAKFSIIDSNFASGIPLKVKTDTMYEEADYRAEIKAVQDKLRMLLAKSNNSSMKIQRIRDSIADLVNRGNCIYTENYIESSEYLEPDRIEGTDYESWALEVEILTKRHLIEHPLYTKITWYISDRNHGVPAYVRCIIDCLYAIEYDDDFFSELEESIKSEKTNSKLSSDENMVIEKASSKIFIVHGHDEAMKSSVARALEKAKLETIILHEKPDAGNTIIEKFEQNADVAYAIVLYSPCDIGRAREASPDAEKMRARQNVLFEHGYLIGRLGRDRVIALVKGEIEIPSDLSGVLYTPMDEHGAWKNKLAIEFKTAGLVFDVEALIL